MSDYGVTPDGFAIKPLSAVLTDLADRARQMFGDDIDLRPTSALRKILDVTAGEDQALWRQAEQLYYSNFTSTAAGQALDLLGEDLGVERRQLLSRGQVAFTLSGGEKGRAYPLPVGTIVETVPADGSEPKRFRTLTHIVLTAAANTALADVDAIGRGPAAGDVAKGDIKTINNDYKKRYLRLGSAAVKVTNDKPTTGGADREDDETYRTRLLDRPRTLWTREAIRAAVRDVDGVRDCRVFDPLGGVDSSLSKFKLIAFGRSPFGTAPQLGSPYFFDVLVAARPGFDWEGTNDVAGIRDRVQTAIAGVRPISIFPNIRLASTVEIGLRARVVVQAGIDTVMTAAAIKNSVDGLLIGLKLGAEVRSSDVLCRCMAVPGVVDVQGLHLRRCPPQFGRTTYSRRRAFQSDPAEADLSDNIRLAPDEIAAFRFDSPLFDLQIAEA